MTRLYLRIWLAVVLAVLLVTAGVGAIIRSHYESRINEQLALSGPVPLPAARDITVRDDQGRTLAQSNVQPSRVPGVGLEYPVNVDGREWVIVMGPRTRASGTERVPLAPARLRASGAGIDNWNAQRIRRAVEAQADGLGARLPRTDNPKGFIVLLATVCVAVALGAYPVVRRLTKRLETLQTGVRQFGQGNLQTRVPVVGKDEIAYLTEQFNESAQRIEALVGAHKTLLANASHELRSPLARLRMGLELSNSGDNPGLHAEMARSIGELDELIEEILLASRLSAVSPGAAHDRPTENIDMENLLAEECARTGACLETTCPSGVLQGDARLVRRLLRNLLENARRHGSDDVQVHWGEHVLEVCDGGPGVPESERQRIFEPFYRLPGATEANGGVGLGLSLVKSIAHHHNAQVSCTDRPDGARGACFTVRFPRGSSVLAGPRKGSP